METTRYTYDNAGRCVRMASRDCDVLHRYGRSGKLLCVLDNSRRLEVS